LICQDSKEKDSILLLEQLDKDYNNTAEIATSEKS